MTKKSYQKPQMTVHGNVETITRNGNSANSDLPDGTVNDNNAFPYV
jgi:hypothetical protein